MVKCKTHTYDCNLKVLMAVYISLGVLPTFFYFVLSWVSHVIQIEKSNLLIHKNDKAFVDTSFLYIFNYNKTNAHNNPTSFISDNFDKDTNYDYYSNYVKNIPSINKTPFRVFGKLKSIELLLLDISNLYLLNKAGFDYDDNEIAEDFFIVIIALFLFGSFFMYTLFGILLQCSCRLHWYEILLSYLDTSVTAITGITLASEYDYFNDIIKKINIVLIYKKAVNLIAILIFTISYINLDLAESYGIKEEDLITFNNNFYSTNKTFGICIIFFLVIGLGLNIFVTLTYPLETLRSLNSILNPTKM